MGLRRAHLVSLGLTAVSFAVWLALYSRLPDPVPTHWDLHGTPNGWTPKPWGALVMPLVQLVALAVLAATPYLSPRRFSIAPFARTFGKLELALMTFTTLANVMAATMAAGMPIVAGPRFIFAAVGVLFVVIGNYLGKVTPNFFVGIRTPWTLASREVWARTHRLGGWLFVAGGLVLVAGAARPSRTLLLTVGVIVALVPVAFSFAIHRRLEGGHDEPPDDDADDDDHMPL